MAATLRIFPVDTVLFPGMRLPAQIEEPRLCRLIERLVAIEPVDRRRLGVVAIREGYQIGRRHGRQSAHRVGCAAVLDRAEPRSDGSWDVEIVGRYRMRVDQLVSRAPSEVTAAVTFPPEIDGPSATTAATEALASFEAYRRSVTDGGAPSPTIGDLPDRPLPLSYALATAAVLPLRERQLLLEAPHAAARLRRLTLMLRVELSAIRAVPSLPATRLARTGWSPN